jgi:1-acyl-sn-glycerol-3-phosphate acyltransferase
MQETEALEVKKTSAPQFELGLLQRVWFTLMRSILKCGLYFYFRKVEVFGKENLPNGAYIFTPNHQNALVDALLLICFTGKCTHSLARASVFQNPAIAWLLGTFLMKPVFRVRDGMKSITKNDAIFEDCYAIVAGGGNLLIFPEGNHNMMRANPTLSKGFTRIAFGAQALANESTDIKIVPVSINYSLHDRSGSLVSIYIAPPLEVKDFRPNISAGEHEAALRLRDEVSKSIASNLVQIPNPYLENVQYIKSTFKDKIVNPAVVNQFFESNSPIKEAKSKNSKPLRLLYKMLQSIGFTINLIPILLLRTIANKLVKDPIFQTTIKVGMGVFLFPIIYFLEGLIFQSLTDQSSAWLWAGSMVGVLMYTRFSDR